MRANALVLVLIALQLGVLAQDQKGVAKKVAEIVERTREKRGAEPGSLDGLLQLGKSDELANAVIKEVRSYASPEDRVVVIGIASDLAGREKKTKGDRLTSQGFGRGLVTVLCDDPAPRVREEAARLLLISYSAGEINSFDKEIRVATAKHLGSLSMEEINVYGLLCDVSLAGLDAVIKPPPYQGAEPSLWVCSLRARHGDTEAEKRLINAVEDCPGDTSRNAIEDRTCHEVLQLATYAGTDRIVRYMAERIYTSQTYIEGGIESPQPKGIMYALTVRSILRDRPDFPYGETCGLHIDTQAAVAKWCSEHLGIHYPQLDQGSKK